MERDKKRGNLSELERKRGQKRMERDKKRGNLSELERKREYKWRREIRNRERISAGSRRVHTALDADSVPTDHI
jgi:hypothetical protein